MGFCAPLLAAAEAGGAALPAKHAVGPAMEMAYTFVPAMHVGVTTGGCGAVLRVSFAQALLPQPVDPADVPVGPAEGTQLRAAGAAGGATVGLAWPGLAPASANYWLLLAWAVNGTVRFLSIGYPGSPPPP